ncbi:hypothetical protein [Cyclobacterium marinum]|uniref:Uncharacterized protein n=1 Tax=Cyclobacterium marinum (strain ATCC 25205 / DSM 745 / LMG 13164 / NCIMB 1802) TaxID=880070 RepID=G0IYE4_CYCMS|nr:hypothetical protein [Cyclobacterium marinum]AEL25679.1 hypothetical protein Cycma_1929 [Cyclobacterium marinum DSM 745]
MTIETEDFILLQNIGNFYDPHIKEERFNSTNIEIGIRLVNDSYFNACDTK